MSIDKGDACGTLGYVAPEVIERHEHSFESDWYSLGVIVHALLVGFLPDRCVGVYKLLPICFIQFVILYILLIQ